MPRAKIVAKLCTPLSACVALKDRASQHKELLTTPHGIALACAGASEGPISEEGVVDIIYHWSSPHNLLFLGPGFHLWTSNDFGDTFVELDTPGRTLGESKLRGHEACWLATCSETWPRSAPSATSLPATRLLWWLDGRQA